MRVEEVLDGVVVRRSGDDHEVGVAVGGSAVERGCQVQLLLCQVFLDVLVLNGRDAVIDFLHFLGDNVDCRHLMVLTEQRGDGQADVARAGYGNFDVFEVSHIDVCFLFCAKIEKNSQL